MQDAIEITTKLRNKKISTLVECQTENKKRLDNTSKNNQNQQQPNKRALQKRLSGAKNQNYENQIKSTKARGVVHAFGGGETEQDLNNIEDEIEA
uniref:Uncharacterized protein n=1 Tax=Tanacetum cinerariifolium TaxID=118510 RepID=A0A699TV35_TANCI|nr:hypothetical protein [Tanacetum cinerariifolium]